MKSPKVRPPRPTLVEQMSFEPAKVESENAESKQIELPPVDLKPSEISVVQPRIITEERPEIGRDLPLIAQIPARPQMILPKMMSLFDIN